MTSVTRLGGIAFFGALAVAVVAAATATVGVQTISPEMYAGLTWRCIGPFDGGPVASVVGAAGEPGVYTITTPSGGVWKTMDAGDTWASIENQTGAAPADRARWVDPANPRRMARTETQGIAVSLDGGETWTALYHAPIAEVASLAPREHQTESTIPPRRIAGQPVTVSIADPARAGLIFAGTTDSVYVSFDNGARWAPLRLNMPRVAINDLDIRGNNLVAATQGRSVWVLDDISPLRQLSAAGISVPAILFKPADAVLPVPWSPGSLDPGNPASSDPGNPGARLDYYLAASSSGDVTLEILDASGRVIQLASSAPATAADPWLPVTPRLSAAPGHHRVVWNLRVDPPPAQQHRYAQLAHALFEGLPADPDGPQVLPGSYRARLTIAGRAYTQLLYVHNDPRTGEAPATLAAQRKAFVLAMKIYDAMRIAHREFVQLARVRAQLRPMLASPDPDIALLAGDLDARLADLDGSDWTGLIVPDADNDEDFDEAEKEGIKHPDFVPSVPVSISKDYDDPTSILGRRFDNVNHAPALATVSLEFGGMLKKTRARGAAPDAAALATWDRTCQELSGVLERWRTMNRQDLPRMNAELAKRKLPALPVSARVSAIACGPGQP